MTEQTKKIMMIIVIIFFLLATAFIVYSMLPSNTNQGGGVDIIMDENSLLDSIEGVTQEDIVEVKEKIEVDCNNPDAPIAEEDKSLCEGAVYAEKAREEGKVNLCDLIDDENRKTACLDNTYMNIALSESNVAACQELSKDDQKMACSNEVNFRLANRNPSEAQSYCDNITSDAMKAICTDKFVK